MMLSLQDREWKEFKLSSIFTIISTSSGIDKGKLNYKSGEFPYVTRSDNNNGINDFICRQELFSIDCNNCITIGLDTQTAFYQSYPFYTGQNIQILRNEHLNDLNAKFLLPLLKKLMTTFSWGSNGATLTRLQRSLILLPIDENANPDWHFMENYIKERQTLLEANYINSAKADLPVKKDIPQLHEKKWKEFFLKDIFPILQAGKSKGLNHLEQTKNGISYLGATNRNNGVLCFVNPKSEMIQKGNGVAFIRNGEGSMGYSVYKKENFIATSDITVGYNEHLNQYIGLFITVVADKVRGKYNFNYKRSDSRLSKEILQLPVNDYESPDFEYMEQYAKNIIHEKISEYMMYKNKSVQI